MKFITDAVVADSTAGSLKRSAAAMSKLLPFAGRAVAPGDLCSRHLEPVGIACSQLGGVCSKFGILVATRRLRSKGTACCRDGYCRSLATLTLLYAFCTADLSRECAYSTANGNLPEAWARKCACLGS